MKIYVGNLSWDTVENTLEERFAEFGEVVSVTIIRDRETGRSRGFGFIEMGTEAAGQNAIEEMNGAMLDGRSLKVNLAHRREERRGGGRSGGGHHGRRDDRSPRRDRGGYQDRRDRERRDW